MASIVLASLAASAGSFLGGGAFITAGGLIGSTVGRFVDNKFFGSSNSRSSAPMLKDLSVQTSSYGITIPIIFGVVRIAGNIIWARPLKEKAITTKHKRRAKGAVIRHSHTEYSYFASFAVSICEGEIDEVINIYAGHEKLQTHLYSIRVYKGSGTQMPDPLIESFEGVGKTPAFRGQAYVVFEDFPLSSFGNNVPNFNFEVRRKTLSQSEHSVANLVKSVVIIPGGGEYVYDTKTQYKTIGSFTNTKWCPRGKFESLNHNSHIDKTNAVLAIDHLQKTFPNLKWVSVVVSWFGTSMNIEDCDILPGVEYWDEFSHNYPDVWKVGNFNRSNAHKISRTDSRPNYGGTINDASLVRFIQELKSRGFKVVLYPMIFMDLPNKPWRGDIGGDYKHIDRFFNNYNKFATHYAKLFKGEIDGFIIASELRTLTSIQAPDGSFPSVDKLIELVKICRLALGNDTIITYAADWSEYHHTKGGWYNMDKLWATPELDVISIDAYFPLSNTKHSLYDLKTISKGWDQGFGYDFYYEDSTRQSSKPLCDQYAWKNIRWWWENYHTNPDGVTTSWQPKSKKIWFTEYGFPSVDCCTNEPNVFYDPSSTNPNYPIHSRGNQDFKAQSSAIIATELKWLNSDMIVNKFLWCWDARPYPYWPDLLHIWSDGKAWNKGHWIQGKTAHSSLTGILEELCIKANLDRSRIVFNKLSENIDGLVIDSQAQIKEIIQLLQKAYQFDLIEKEGKIHFSLDNPSALSINYDELAVAPDTPILSINRNQEIDLPRRIDVNYVDIAQNYQISNQHTYRMQARHKSSISLDLPMTLNQDSARQIAERYMHNIWHSRNHYSFYLPPKYLHISAGDLLKLKCGNKNHDIKIIKTQIGKNNLLKIDAVSYKKFHKAASVSDNISQNITDVIPLSNTEIEILDIPYLPISNLDESYILIAATAKTDNWSGATIFKSSIKGSGYEELTYIDTLATTGHAISKLRPHTPGLIDYESGVIVNLEYGELASVGLSEINNGANFCMIAGELLQFQNALLIDKNQYELSILYRGLQGTESSVYSHEAGDRFIMINEALKKIDIPLNELQQIKYFKAVSNGQTLGQSHEIEFTYHGNCKRAFSPIHISLNGNNLTWMRRNRMSCGLLDYVDIPIEYSLEHYLVHLVSKDSIQTIQTSNTTLSLASLKGIQCIKICQLSNMGMEGFYGSLIMGL